MPSNANYTFIDLNNDVTIAKAFMNKAVRVKSTVADKIKKVYLKSKNKAVKEDDANVNAEISKLLNENKNNLISLNEKLNNLVNQRKVPMTKKRAVLFTKPLVEKIEKVNDKWFEGMEKALSNSDSKNAVPGNWDSIEANLNNEVNSELEFNPIANLNVENVNKELDEPNTIEEPKVINDMKPLTELEPVTLEQPAEPVPVESPVEQPAEPVPVEPSVEQPAEPVPVEPSVEQPAEPAPVESSVEQPAEPVPVESPVEQPAEPVPVEPSVEQPAEEKKSIEDRISELLNRKNKEKEESKESTEKEENVEDKVKESKQEKKREVKKVKEEPANEEADRKLDTNKEAVMAKLQRISSNMHAKDEENNDLRTQLESAKEDARLSKEKCSGYETVVSDLTAKCNSLSKENEELIATRDETETKYKDEVTSLREELEALKESSRLEKERMDNEMASLKESHANELKSLEERKNKEISAIYDTIAEVLGVEPEIGNSISK